MDLPKRKQIRLPEFDYSSPGAYFVTICTHERQCILSDITVGAATSRPPELHLSDNGEIVDRAINMITAIHPCISVDNYVIMPNHVHLILRICTDNGGRQVAAPTVGSGTDGQQIAAPTINSVIGQMKRWATIQAKTTLWQKSFYEHVIRNENDYREIWRYIDDNPARWAEDKYYTE